MTLRELVAVEVMGWRVHCRNTAHYVLASEANDTYRAPQALVSEFRPDTNIADAWRVAEKIKGPDGKGPFDCGSPFKRGEVREEYWARFGGYFVEPSTADTMPLAICLAALRACGVSEDRIEQARKGNA